MDVVPIASSSHPAADLRARELFLPLDHHFLPEQLAQCSTQASAELLTGTREDEGIPWIPIIYADIYKGSWADLDQFSPMGEQLSPSVYAGHPGELLDL